MLPACITPRFTGRAAVTPHLKNQYVRRFRWTALPDRRLLLRLACLHFLSSVLQADFSGGTEVVFNKKPSRFRTSGTRTCLAVTSNQPRPESGRAMPMPSSALSGGPP